MMSCLIYVILISERLGFQKTQAQENQGFGMKQHNIQQNVGGDLDFLGTSLDQNLNISTFIIILIPIGQLILTYRISSQDIAFNESIFPIFPDIPLVSLAMLSIVDRRKQQFVQICYATRLQSYNRDQDLLQLNYATVTQFLIQAIGLDYKIVSLVTYTHPTAKNKTVGKFTAPNPCPFNSHRTTMLYIK